MDRRRGTAALAFVAIMLALAVVLAEVVSAYRKSAIVSALVGVFSLGAVMAARDDRLLSVSVIVGIVASGFVGAVYWDSIDRYRLPPTQPETYIIVPIVVVFVGLLGYGVGVIGRYRDPPLRPSTAGRVRLLVATVIGVCLFLALSTRFLGSAGFVLAIGCGALLVVLLTGYNGYDGGIPFTAVLIAMIVTTSVVAGISFADALAPVATGGGIDDMPSTGVGTLVFVVPAIALGLITHRIGRSVEHRRSFTE